MTLVQQHRRCGELGAYGNAWPKIHAAGILRSLEGVAPERLRHTPQSSSAAGDGRGTPAGPLGVCAPGPSTRALWAQLPEEARKGHSSPAAQHVPECPWRWGVWGDGDVSFHCHTLSTCGFSPRPSPYRGHEESGIAPTSVWTTALHCVQLSIQAQTLNLKLTPNWAIAQADFSGIKNSSTISEPVTGPAEQRGSCCRGGRAVWTVTREVKAPAATTNMLLPPAAPRASLRPGSARD